MVSELGEAAQPGTPASASAKADGAMPERTRPGESATWTDELRRVADDLGLEELHLTCLKPGWEADAFEQLRRERDRLLVVKTGLGFLNVDAAARVDRRLAAASKIIDSRTNGLEGEAALKLNQAEHMMQLAWWSVRWNRWKPLMGFPLWMWVTGPLAAALGGTVFVIFDQALYPQGSEVSLPTALFGAALWGLGGAIANGLRTVHIRVQGQEFARDRIAWYGLSPVLGLAFGAIVFLLFIGGLLSTGQDLGASSPATANPTAQDLSASSSAAVNPTPILLLAVLAGFAQNAFIGALQQIIKAQFRGASPEEETPV